MTRLRLGVIGVGHLGKEHARILADLPGVELVGVADPNRTQVEAVAARCQTQPFHDHRLLLEQVDALVLAAPTSLHHQLGRECLQAGKHLLIEKPLARTPEQAADLVDLAREKAVILQVGHIERFNPAFEELQSRPLRPRYLTTQRCGGFTGRSMDIGVVLDLMIHDLDLVLKLVQAPVRRVEAMGIALFGPQEDLAQARVSFANGCVADFCASRAHPEAKRTMHLWAVEGFAGLDFAQKRLTLIQPSEPLRQAKLEGRELDSATLASLRTELFGTHLQTRELDCSQRHRTDQLTRELEEFVDCVRTGSAPRVDGQAGLEALELAKQILDSMAAHRWDGSAEGFTGPHHLPEPEGRLFTPVLREAA